MNKLLFLFLLMFFAGFPVAACGAQPMQAASSQIFDLEQCIDIALKNHPSILAARGIVEVNNSRIGEAKSNYLPQVSFTSSYDRINPAPPSTSFSPNQTGAYDDYRNIFAFTQNIYDFGRTSSQVDIQKSNYESSRFDLENVRNQAVFNVKQAYFTLLQAGRNRDVAQDTVKQFELHLEQARGFYQVGKRALFDVTKAEVDLSNARLNLIQAENSVSIAHVTLNNALGMPDAAPYEIVDILIYQPYGLTLEDAINQAFTNRPDLLSVLAKKAAAEQTISYARSGHYPFLTGNASYGWIGASLGDQQTDWSIGAALNFPIFTGFLRKYQVDEAQANLRVLNANENTIRQNIISDVQQAFLSMREAEERTFVGALTVRQAEENMTIATGRYVAGVGNPIEVTDALVNLNNARTTYNQALYDSKTAQARMDLVIGIHY